MASDRKAESERTTALPRPDAFPPASSETPQRSELLMAPYRPVHKWGVAGTVMLSAFLVVVNASTVNVTLPPMMSG